MIMAPQLFRGVWRAAVDGLILGLLPSCSKPAVKPSTPLKAASAHTNSAPADPDESGSRIATETIGTEKREF
jgi:hypothetical protein